MDKLIMGRYLPGDSWVHHLDPRTKFCLSFFYVLVVFLVNNPLSFAVAGAFTLLAMALTRIPAMVYIRGLRPLAMLMLVSTMLQLFFIQTGPVLVQLGPIVITQDGVINSVVVFSRFMLIMMFTTILTLTTPPLLIATAMEMLMAPLKKLHVPVSELALMVSIALRFVPTLMDEAVNIMNAQRSRGMVFNEGGLIRRAKSYVPLLIPLFVNAIKRAVELGDAMEARGYRDSEHRSRFRVLKVTRADYWAVAGFVVFTILLFLTHTY